MYRSFAFLLLSGAVAAVACSDSSGDEASNLANEPGAGGNGGDGAVPDGTSPRLLPDGGLAEPDAGPSAPTYKHYDINHVLSTGASDAVANGASQFITREQPFGNVSFDTGVMTVQSCDGNGCRGYETPSGFKPLVEGDRFFGYGVETMASGMANQATVLAKEYFARVGLPPVQHDMLVSQHGRSGNPYWCLRLQVTDMQPGYGPCYFPRSSNYLAPFEEAMMQVRSAKALAEAAGKTYVVRAATAIHGQGESDSNEQNFALLHATDGSGRRIQNYTEALLDWQWGYDAKVKEITGQTEPVPLFISQFGTMTTAESIIPQRQLDAHVQSQGKVILVTPNYPFPAYSDCNHYTAHSQRWLGAQFAKAYQKVVVEGGTWDPVRPLSVTRAGTTITVKYIVPVPPLVIDTDRVSANTDGFVTKPFLGFLFRDSTMSASITNVVVSAPDTVTITLSNEPSGASPVLRYAYESQTYNRCPGPTSGARGNIRDSDPTVAHHTDADGKPYELFNWGVAFEAKL